VEKRDLKRKVQTSAELFEIKDKAYILGHRKWLVKTGKEFMGSSNLIRSREKKGREKRYERS